MAFVGRTRDGGDHSDIPTVVRTPGTAQGTILLAMVWSEDLAAVTGVSSNVDGAFQLLGSAFGEGAFSASGIKLYILLDPTNVEATFTPAFSNSNSEYLASICIAEYSGIAQEIPDPGSIATSAGTSDTPSVTVSTASGETVVDAIYTGRNRTVVGANQTERSSLFVEGDGFFFAFYSDQAGADGGVMSWTLEDSDLGWASIGVSLAPFAEDVGTVPVDRFDAGSLDTDLWTTFTAANSTVGVSNDELVLTADKGGEAIGWALIRSDVSFDLEEYLEWSMELVSVTGELGVTAYHEVGIQKNGDPNNFLYFAFYNNNLRAYRRLAGSSLLLTEVAYNSTNHRWLKIRYSVGEAEIIWETSANGVTWTEFAQYAAGFDISAMQVSCYSQAEGAAAVITLDNSGIIVNDITATDGLKLGETASGSIVGGNQTGEAEDGIVFGENMLTGFGDDSGDEGIKFGEFITAGTEHGVNTLPDGMKFGDFPSALITLIDNFREQSDGLRFGDRATHPIIDASPAINRITPITTIT